MFRRQLTYANVMSTLAVFLVVAGGTAFASYVVRSNSEVGPNTIAGHTPPSGAHANIIGGSINGSDLKSPSIWTGKLFDRAVTNPKLAPGAVTGTKVAPDSLTGSKIAESTLDPTALQFRGTTTTCPSDQLATGISQAGNLSCEFRPHVAWGLIDNSGFVVSNQTSGISNADVLKPNTTTGIYCFRVGGPAANYQITPYGPAARYATVTNATHPACDTYAPYITIFDSSGTPIDSSFWVLITSF